MRQMSLLITKEDHKKLAIKLFNQVWNYIEKTDRSEEDDALMIHMAHTSLYHWGLVGKAVNLSRGEWQISRVYAVLERAEPAIYHAKRNLKICEEHGIGDFDLAFAYEALARAYKASQNKEKCSYYKNLAIEAAQSIEKKEDKELLLNDLDTI